MFYTSALFSQENNVSNKPLSNNDSLKIEIKGTIISKIGNKVNIKITEQSKKPIIGQVGTLSKYFEEKIFGINTTGWLDIGKTKVIALKLSTLTLYVIEEHSVIIKNDKKVDNFKVGATVKFEY